MNLIKSLDKEPVRLKLARDHSRRIKQGFPWIYNDWLQDLPQAQAGSRALVRDKSGELLAFGMYDSKSPIAVRICALEKEKLDQPLILQRLDFLLKLRKSLFAPNSTTGYRLINGEGDGLPGIVCDIYNDTAVIKLDGAGPTGFWDLNGFSQWLVSNLGIKVVFEKLRAGGQSRGHCIHGELKDPTISFLENGLNFQANIIDGQKSGFFFDQRENRALIGKLAKGCKVLNLFGYTGGFSIYAGAGGAKHVTTVDIAQAAINESQANWALNKLPQDRHNPTCADVFDFLKQLQINKEKFDLIIVDPPSFAASEKNVETAKQSYQDLFALALHSLESNGKIAFSSCSSHIPSEMFLEICQAALSKARRRGTILAIHGQPADHPFPFACRELQYLKFVLMAIN